MVMLRLNETFSSVQGEGYWMGRPATFIRLHGCKVGCPWCDTKYTWGKGGQDMTEAELVDTAIACKNKHVVITGGEPLLQDLDELLDRLHALGYYTQIETSGAEDFKGKIRPDWLTWSPKPNLMYLAKPTVFKNFDEVKFVIDDVIAFDVILSMVRDAEHRKGGPIRVVLMPEGAPPTKAHIDRAMEWVMRLDQSTSSIVTFGGRLQWQLNIK